MARALQSIRINLMIGAAVLISTGLVVYGYIAGEHLYSVESPLLNTAAEIEFEAARTRIWMRDVAAGIREYEDDFLFDHLEQSINYLESLTRAKKIPGVDSDDQKTVAIYSQTGRLISFLGNLKQILNNSSGDRSEGRRIAKRLAEIDRVFSDFSTTLSSIKATVSATVERARMRFRILQATLIGLTVLLIACATIAIIDFNRQRVRDFENLERARQDLQKELAGRREAESALAKRMQLIRAVFDNSPVPIIVTRLADNRVIDLNESFLAASGYDREEVLGRTLGEIPLWENPTERDRVLQQLRRDRQVRDMELRFRTKDGRDKTFLGSANVVEINGEAHILATGRDVTELKDSERALKESEGRLQAVVDNLPVGVWFTDETGRIEYGNPAALKIWGGAHRVGPDEFHEYRARWAGTGIALGPHDWAVARAVRKGETSLNEVLDIDCFDGTQKTILNSAVPMRDSDGRITGVVVLNNDITERKQAEARMMWLASFPALNPYPIVEVDLNGRVHHLNPAAEREFPDLAKLGTGHAWLCDWEPVTRTFRNGGSRTVVREVPSEGKWYHQALVWVEEEQRVRIYGLDITWRKDAEEALKTSHDALETWVNERTQQLLEANQRLQSEVEERLQTERSLVKHQAQLRQLSRALIQTEERERRRISNATHDGIGQTLAAAKIKLGAVRSSLPPGEVSGQLDEVRDLISSAIQETRTLTFELSLPVLYEIGLQPALEWLAEQYTRKFSLRISVEGDGCDQSLDVPDRVFLFQAIRELCFNVVKHARASHVRVSIKSDPDAGGIRCEVVDDGTGFDVKKKFQDADNEMGFGLFGIREQLRYYGGSLTLDTNRDSGTCVVLRIPTQGTPP